MQLNGQPAVRAVLLCAAAAGTVLLVACGSSLAATSKQESQCAAKLTKEVGKLAATAAKEYAKCLTKQQTGRIPGPCPSDSGNAKIAARQAQLRVVASKYCRSTCSLSQEIECVASDFCPPVGSGAESCSGGATGRPFDMHALGFPGPFCAGVLGREISAAADIGECASILAVQAMDDYVALVYGSTTAATEMPSDVVKCQGAIEKGARKLMTTAFRGITRCRTEILRGKRTTNPRTCVSDDPKLKKKISRASKKLRKLMVARCTDSLVAQLDVCKAGVGGTANVSDVAACISTGIQELVDSPLVPAARTYSALSLVESVLPPDPVCGDNLVDQLPGPFLLLGEECDGMDDAACPGQCLPPGDLFECTCGNIPRLRFFASVDGSETDAGWTGLSHNQDVADRSGYVTELSNCNCSAFTGATCTGTTSDSVCDVRGFTQPACSWDLRSAVRCDAHGNNDGLDEDSDCFICDALSQNAGAGCAKETDCQSLCYNADGIAGAPCERQSDCPIGEVCRGRCDKRQTCVTIPNGGPLPVNSAGAAICAVQEMRTDIVGTRDIVTGAHELFYEISSRIHTADRTSRPCPVCGGFCEGGKRDLELCQGRCSDSETACRFDSDCPAGETCSPESPDCPGGSCQLSLVCGADRASNAAIIGKPCRIELEHPLFGTLSSDCQPSSSRNVSGAAGLRIQYDPATSDAITLPATIPCTAPGFELYDCPCPDEGGQPTAPNACAPACNAGPNFGLGCGDGGEGLVTECAGGANAGRACDDDADCPGSSCSANPTHCVGDPAFLHVPCNSNADCGLGTCVDACPGGRCVPLCLPSAADPFDGVCAAGPPVYHCSGAAYAGTSCSKASAVGGCQAICSNSGVSCSSDADCTSGESCTGPCDLARDCEAGGDGILGTEDDIPGSGICVAGERSCFLDPITAEGGSTLNGRGDPTNVNLVSVFCFGKVANNPAFNFSAGFGGPGRVRVRGTNIPNFTSIP